MSLLRATRTGSGPHSWSLDDQADRLRLGFTIEDGPDAGRRLYVDPASPEHVLNIARSLALYALRWQTYQSGQQACDRYRERALPGMDRCPLPRGHEGGCVHQATVLSVDLGALDTTAS